MAESVVMSDVKRVLEKKISSLFPSTDIGAGPDFVLII